MKIKPFIISAISVLLMLTLCACSWAETEKTVSEYVYSLLGINNTDYAVETVISELDVDSETALSLAKTASVLAYGDTVITFDKFKDVAEDYIDTVLNYLSGTYYAKYSADAGMLEEFSRYYPELLANTLIPQADYENTVYSFFGGNKRAVNKSTAKYAFLDKIDAYLLMSKLTQPDITYTVHSLSETENTYKMTLTFYEEGVSSERYTVIFVKREEGTPYMWRVNINDEIVVPDQN